MLPLLSALRRVFKKMIGSDAVVGRPTVLRAWREEPSAVVAVIAAHGAHSGAFALSLCDATADALAGELFDESADDAPENSREAAVSELARMVVNIVRRDKRVAGIELCAPVVRSTGPIGEMPQKLRPWVTIPIATAVGTVTAGLSLSVSATGSDECVTSQPLEGVV
jgi:CheY-specific phosphatase CheX